MSTKGTYIDETDIIGHKQGKLTVVSFHGRENGNIYYNCFCECGTTWKLSRSKIRCLLRPVRSCKKCSLLANKKSFAHWADGIKSTPYKETRPVYRTIDGDITDYYKQKKEELE